MRLMQCLLFLFLLFFSTSMNAHSLADFQEVNSCCLQKKAKKDKAKGPESLSIFEREKIIVSRFEEASAKFQEARQKEQSLIPTLLNHAEVIQSLHEAAFLYLQAALLIKENLKYIDYFKNREALALLIHQESGVCQSEHDRCLQKAQAWTGIVVAACHAVVGQITLLQTEGPLLEEQGQLYRCQQIYQELAKAHEKLIKEGFPDSGNLAACQKKILEIQAARDAKRLKTISPLKPHEEFTELEHQRREEFFLHDTENFAAPCSAIPLDGQGPFLYTGQYYRYLIQKDVPASHLKIKVFENGTEIDEETLEIPFHGELWDRYLTSEGMLFIPDTRLHAQYGLDLRLTKILDPYHDFSLIISQKGAHSTYDFSFYLEDDPLYAIRWVAPPPHQLEALRKPVLPEARMPSIFPSSLKIEAEDCNDSLAEFDQIPYPILDQFVQDMKRDPLVLAQYVHNEIQTIDPFHKRHEGKFLAAAIHRNPLRTFLEGQGSAWEQCALLTYLLRSAGYQVRYVDATCSLPARYVEELLFLKLPDEDEVLLEYPGVLFLDGDQWRPLFPWMKEIDTFEGYELYSLLPEEYASAERWLKHYLCNDESILKHIGPDGDDTAGVLFVRFLEEHLRQKGYSLQDVGIHRSIHKKQFVQWEDFPLPSLQGEIRSFASLSDKRNSFAFIRIKIISEQTGNNFETQWLNLSNFSCDAIAIYFSLHKEEKLHLCFFDRWNDPISLPLVPFDQTFQVQLEYQSFFSDGYVYQCSKQFPLAKGTYAALCFESGRTNSRITSYFAEMFNRQTSKSERLHALLSFIGATFFEKCSKSSQILASLHKIPSPQYFFCGLSKLSPETILSVPNLPQIDMHQSAFDQEYLEHPFAPLRAANAALRQYCILNIASISSNEHQVLKEFYQDPYAISTVKLLQIAHENHQRKGLQSTGFLTLSAERFALAEANPGSAQVLYFSQLPIDLTQVKKSAGNQWKNLQEFFQAVPNTHHIAWVTPGLVSSRDGFGLTRPSYTGFATLALSANVFAAWISVGEKTMNGGYGSRLPTSFLDNAANPDWQLVSNGSSYSFLSKDTPLIFSGIPPYQTSKLDTQPLPDFSSAGHGQPLPWLDSLAWTPGYNRLKPEVRQELRSSWDTVADPVDVITGAFYVDEVDLSLPGQFPLEVRRNYSSQNTIPGILGYGWKLSLNPYLYEEDGKLFASEKDGSVIVYRKDESQNRWVVLPEDNPELKNFNSRGIGGTANPFHAYVERGDDDILYGGDGSKRVFRNQLLQTWWDHAGNTLKFSYDGERLKSIESSNGGFLGFVYHHGGAIAEAYTKDGRRVQYSYDFEGNLASVTLPNGANVSYEYDHSHRILRETKPHGLVLENLYREGKVVEQRSPVGPGQQMVTSALFDFQKGVTRVTDAMGGQTEYKLYNNQIYQVTDPVGNRTFQSWFLDKHTYFDAETETVQAWPHEGAYPRSLKSSTDKRSLTTHYMYDDRGNPKEITLVGDNLDGNGETRFSRHFQYNALNLCVEEEVAHMTTKTSYGKHVVDADGCKDGDAGEVKMKNFTASQYTFPYLPKRVEKFADGAQIAFSEFDYTPQGQVSRLNQSGAETLFEYDSRGFPIAKIQKTGTEDPDVVTRYRYNEQGQCVDLVTADGIEHHDYDVLGNLRCQTISLHSGKTLSKTYFGYDLNNQPIWQQGDNVHDTTFFDYNAAGLLKATRKSLTQMTGSTVLPAGTAYTLYEYDTCGRMIEKVDPLGNCTYHLYDAIGRLISTTLDGHTHVYTYEPGGLIASATTPGGSTATRFYTSIGLLTREEYPDGTQLSCCYDLLGRKVKEEANGIVNTIDYHDTALEEIRTQGELQEIRRFDSRGNLLSFTDRAGFTWKKTYDALNRLKTQLSPDGELTTWNYQGDTIICTHPSGEKTIQRFEAGILAESQTLAADGSVMTTMTSTRSPAECLTTETLGDITTTTWTSTLGLPLKVQQGGKTTYHHYDACGNCIATHDADGNLSIQTFDHSGRLVRKTLPDGAIVDYTYDADSNLTTYQMPGSLTWKAEYDSLGRKTAEWQESAGQRFQKKEYHYENGRLSATIDPQGRRHTYEYDSHGRLTQEMIENSSRTYAYDPRGLVHSIREQGIDASEIQRSYDASGRLIQEKTSLNGTIIQDAKQTWTPSSRTLQIGEHERRFCYQGRQLKSLSSADLHLSYEHAASSSLIKKTTPLTSQHIEYNDSALPTAVHANLLGSTFTETLDWTAEGKLRSHHSTYPDTQLISYSYNPRGFLTSANEQSFQFDFDQPGRGIVTAVPEWTMPENGLDALGRVVRKSPTSETVYDPIGQAVTHEGSQLTWDSWGRLIAVSNRDFEWTASYDALGRRLRTTYSPLKTYLFFFKEKPIVSQSFYDPEHEFREIGISDGQHTFWKFYGPNGCDAVADQAGEIAILHYDLKNHLQAVITADEILWNKEKHSPYGPRAPPEAAISTLASYAQSLGWHSLRADPTGLIWLGARYYDPKCTRFLSPDPISHPDCLDLYAYANGDPINYFDPDGRFSSPVYSNNSQTSSLPKVRYISDLEEMYRPDNPCIIFDLGRPELPGGLALTWMNGMDNSEKDSRKSAKYISDLSGGYNVHSVYASCTSFENDFIIAVYSTKKYVDFGAMEHLHKVWNDHFDRHPDGYILHFCHSRGASETRNALLMFPEERRNRIFPVAIAPAGYIYRQTCAAVVHYRVKPSRDLVPYALDQKGAKRESSTIVELDSHPEAPMHDHSFQSPTYRDVIVESIDQFKRKQKM